RGIVKENLPGKLQEVLPTMRISLVVEKARKVQRIPLRAAKTIIGRRQGCGVRVPSSEVSRQHCVLRVEKPGYLTVEDLNSANGTFLNGHEISGRQVVRPGDRLEVGPVTFVAEYEMTQQVIDHLRQHLGEEVAEEAVLVEEEVPVLEEEVPVLEE